MGTGASVASQMKESSSIHYPNQSMLRDFTDVYGFYIETGSLWNRIPDIAPRPSGAFSRVEPYLYIALHCEDREAFVYGPTLSARNSHLIPGPLPHPYIRPGILLQHQ